MKTTCLAEQNAIIYTEKFLGFWTLEGAPSERTHCEDRNMDANYGRINGLRRQLLIVDDDPISRALDSASQGVHRMAYGTESGKDIADKLKELNDLRSANLITEEEYQRKREELMKRF